MPTAILDGPRFEPDQRADSVIKQILLELLDTLERQIEGARIGADPEFLHDLRVATRRTRSILGQTKGIFPEPILADFKTGFAWLQEVTGSARDLDVHLHAFDTDQDRLPPPMRAPLEALRLFLLDSQKGAQTRLAETLDSARLGSLLSDWRNVLTAPSSDPAEAPSAERPIKPMADARIRRLTKRVRRAGRAIHEQSPPAQLHELRKLCKKLRYLMEAFADLYPQKALGALLKPLKQFLDQLGAHQDLVVQAAHLRDMAEQLRKAPQTDTDTLLAMGVLIGDRLARQQEARRHIAEGFAEFDSPHQRQAYKRLFWPPAQDDGATASG